MACLVRLNPIIMRVVLSQMAGMESTEVNKLNEIATAFGLFKQDLEIEGHTGLVIGRFWRG